MKNFKLFFLLPAVAFMACSKDSDEELGTLEGLDPANEISENQDITEIAFPDAEGAVSDVYFAGMKIPVESFQGEYVYQGDIMFSPDMVTSEPVELVYEKDQIPAGQKSVGRTSGRWPDNTVYYAIEGKLPNQQRVIDAIKHWEANTNLKFVKRSTQQNYVYFVTGSGCSSYVGMIGGRQEITLSNGCSTGNTIHEIGHAIGLWHEQSRVDRNSYVTINYKNIEKGREHNFQTYQEQGFDGDEFTSSLDFGSIMMYGPYSFSKNGKPTMVTRSGDTYRVQRSALSTGDKTGVNNMYPYTSGGSPSKTVEPIYENGEYYTVNGLRVLRMYERWYYYHSRYGFKEVRVSASKFWYYA